jgi:hypothetical protein
METASRSQHPLRMVGGTIAFRDRRVPTHVAHWGRDPPNSNRVGHWRLSRKRAGLVPVWHNEVTEAEDGTFPVELWSSQGESRQLIYKTRGFQTRELAEAWMVPVQVRSRAGEPRARVVYLKPERSRVNVPNPLPPPASPLARWGS